MNLKVNLRKKKWLKKNIATEETPLMIITHREQVMLSSKLAEQTDPNRSHLRQALGAAADGSWG